MKLMHVWHCAQGTFTIRQEGKVWIPCYQDEALSGHYPSAQHALDDLAWGHTDLPSCGDPSKLGMPDDLGDWELIRV